MCVAIVCISAQLTPSTASAQMSGPSHYNSRQQFQANNPIEPPSEADDLLGAPSEQPDYAGQPMGAPARQTTNIRPSHTYSKRSGFFAPGNRAGTAAQLGEVDPYSDLSSFSEDDGGSTNGDIAPKRMIYSASSSGQKFTEMSRPSSSRNKETTTIYKNPW